MLQLHASEHDLRPFTSSSTGRMFCERRAPLPLECSEFSWVEFLRGIASAMTSRPELRARRIANSKILKSKYQISNAMYSVSGANKHHKSYKSGRSRSLSSYQSIIHGNPFQWDKMLRNIRSVLVFWYMSDGDPWNGDRWELWLKCPCHCGEFGPVFRIKKKNIYNYFFEVNRTSQ